MKNTSLHADLEEQVYTGVPLGFSIRATKGNICRLKKALYGLNQPPREKTRVTRQKEEGEDFCYHGQSGHLGGKF